MILLLPIPIINLNSRLSGLRQGLKHTAEKHLSLIIPTLSLGDGDIEDGDFGCDSLGRDDVDLVRETSFKVQ